MRTAESASAMPYVLQVPAAMGRYSPAYHSPPRRGHGGRGRSPPPRRGYGGGGGGGGGGGRGGRGGDQGGSVSLLVRNIPLRCRLAHALSPCFVSILFAHCFAALPVKLDQQHLWFTNTQLCRPEELRVPFERFGPVRDVYLPRDYHTG
jgi:FUS-interacting serine-arginine-rich protein 1